MKYKISDISRLLDISSNTVRRYEKMGYISPAREDKNGYRYYSDTDINRIISIRMLRKYGFAHNEIGEVANKNIGAQVEYWERHLNEMKEEIDYLTKLTIRLDGNIKIVQRVENLKNRFEIKECVDMKYVLYQKDGRLLNDKDGIETVHEFMYCAQEVQPVMLFAREALEKNELCCNAGWAVKTRNMEKLKLKENSFVNSYPKRKCVFTTLRLFADREKYLIRENKEVIKKDFSQINNFIEKNNLKIAADALGVNAATADENGEDIQYFLLSIPVEEK